MIRYLLQVAAIVLFLFAVLTSYGWILSQSFGHAIGYLAAGLLCNTLAAIPDRPPPT